MCASPRTGLGETPSSPDFLSSGDQGSTESRPTAHGFMAARALPLFRRLPRTARPCSAHATQAKPALANSADARYCQSQLIISL